MKKDFYTERTEKLEKDIDIAVELLMMLKNSNNLYGNTDGVNYAEIKRTRLMVHDLLRRNEK